MGMGHDMSAMAMKDDMGTMSDGNQTHQMDNMSDMDMKQMTDDHSGHAGLPSAPKIKVTHQDGGHGPGAAMIAENPISRLNEPGVGLEHVDHRVLVYVYTSDAADE